MTEIERLREALLPCPFCGGEASASVGATGDGQPWHYIECLSCAASTEPDVWNRRAALASTPPGAERGEWKGIDDEAKNGRRLLLAGYQQEIPWVAIGHWAPYAGLVWNSDDMKPLQGVVGYQELPAPPSPPASEK